MKFFSQLFLRMWSGLLLYVRADWKAKTVRCETCPRWRFHSAVLPKFANAAPANVTFSPVHLGVCRLSRPVIINQGGVGFGIRLFHPTDWCPNHPLYRPAPATDLPAYMPPLDAVKRNVDGTEGAHAGFERAPSFEEAMRLARVLQEADSTPKPIKPL